MNPIYGTPEKDTLIGTAGDDTIAGGAGDDSLVGGEGNDLLIAGAGLDTLIGGAGDDEFYSRTTDMVDDTFDDGANLVFGGPGNDLFIGGLGYDTASGDEGDDSLYGQAGQDRFSGGAGDDILAGDLGDDSLSGDAGNDLIGGGDGNDNLDGGEGHDDLYGDAGDDSLVGGNGNDTLSAGTGFDTLIGGAGDDRFYSRTSNMDPAFNDGANLISGGAGNDQFFGGLGHDTASGDEGDDTLQGEAGGDQLAGGSGNDLLFGQAGSDQLEGHAGRDTIDGGDDSDTIDGGDDDDSLIGGAGDDSISGGTGNDALYGDTGNDTLAGNQGADQLSGHEGVDFLTGGEGNDTLDGGDDDDSLEGGAGSDSLIGGTGNDLLDGQDGDDTLIAGPGLDTLIGGAGNDRLYSRAQTDIGNDGANSVDGGSGDDSFAGGLGDDTVIGGSGHDTLHGAEGNDHLRGGDDDDELYGAEGNDTLDGGAGANLLVGGEGNDHYVIASPLTRIVEQSGSADDALVLVDFFKRPAGIESFVLGSGVARLPYWIDGLIPVDGSSGYFATLLGPARQIGYSFPAQIPSYLRDSKATDGQGFEAFTPSQQSATAQALAYLQGVIDLQFLPVANADAPNVIALSNNAQTGSAGYARYPSSSPTGSDVFLSTDASQQNADPVAGTYGALTLIHEISHALGLKHPFADEDDPNDSLAILPKPEETVRWTVMSYDNQGEANKAFWVSTLRPLDIAALQYLYGPSASARPGNDVYRVGTPDPARAGDITLISPDQPSFIWDGGGNDRIDASQAQAAVVMTLEPGYRGWVGAWAESITAPGQITINFGTRIESLTGSTFADKLFGNSLDNLVEGGAGNDQIAAGAGHDRLLGEAGIDSLSGGDGNDTLIGGPGADRMTGDAGDDRFELIDSGDHIWGGTGRDVGVFNAPSTLFRARAISSGDQVQWLLDKAETDWASVALADVEELVFSDRTVTSTSLSADALSAAGRGLVWHWKSHAVMSAAILSGDAGSESTNTSTGSGNSAINAADVLATLKLATGRPTSTSPGSGQTEPNPFQRLAADINGDHAVSSLDARTLLDIALGSQALPDDRWLFIPERTQLGQGTASASQTAVSPAAVMGNDLPDASAHNWIAMLRGDVDGSWQPAASSQTVTLSDDFLRSLAQSQSLAPAQWGIAETLLPPASGLVIELDPLMLG